IEKQGLVFLPVSAATRQGLEALPEEIWRILKELPPVITYEPDFMPEEAQRDPRAFTVTRRDDGSFDVASAFLEGILAGSDIDDYESLQYFQRQLADTGVLEKLTEMGVKENDTVRVGDFEFDYIF
ncbi:MAG: Obg family GTPase CgtA, partial [Oscillospiraceae bacterium]|nr:Obg family GTPase CgtA [Oscillospiraceae bacterium]